MERGHASMLVKSGQKYTSHIMGPFARDICMFVALRSRNMFRFKCNTARVGERLNLWTEVLALGRKVTTQPCVGKHARRPKSYD